MDCGEIVIDPKELRRAFGTFVTGITVVTANDAGGTPRGMTANSFTSVSLDPPLLLVCIGKSASSFPVFEQADCFAVNLLHENQAEVSSVFAARVQDKFSVVNTDVVHTGAPVLTDCLTWFDCTVFNRIDAGDHIILVGRIQAFGTSPLAPLAFCRGQYAKVSDPLPDGWIAFQSMVVSYLVESDDHVLLCDDGKGNLLLPTGRGHRIGPSLALDGCEPLEFVPEQTFLYSVYDTAETGRGHLVYRASMLTPRNGRALPSGMEFFRIDDLPYDRMESRELRAVLRRFARERTDRRFGIYVDGYEGGRVAMIESEGAYSA
ncbi:MAG: flavin reductase family protein [Rhizobiales bacterium]|nr:flavin reductase family protein [Hyphomicrobiales bacterium]OJY02867.1 MAG: flavin reductase [Rhizobiales bacterium 63-22]